MNPAPEILVLCPTRGRNAAHRELAASFLKTKPKRSRLVFGVDRDETGAYEAVHDDRIGYWSKGEPGLVAKVNAMCADLVGTYRIVFFVGDDSRFVSSDWEDQVLEAWERGARIIGVASGYHDGELPVNFFVDARIVRALGWYWPPSLWHMCGDDFHLALGEAIGAYEFIAGCLIEHRHFLTGKSEPDALSAATNNQAVFRKDFEAFDAYLANGYAGDVENVCRALGLRYRKPTPRFKARANDGAAPRSKRKLKAMFLTPFHDGRVTTNYTLSMLAETVPLLKAGIEWEFQASFSGVVHWQRNNLTAAFLHSDCDFAIMVDSDMGFRGGDLLRMIEAELPVVTVNAPARNYFFDDLASGTYRTMEEVRNALLHGTVRVAFDRPPVRGMKEIDYAGFSVAVIRREVFETIVAKGLVDKLTQGNVQRQWLPFLWRFFFFSITPPGHPLGAGRELHEDFGFCDLVRRAGFKLYADPATIVSHAGYHEFTGKPAWPKLDPVLGRKESNEPTSMHEMQR